MVGNISACVYIVIITIVFVIIFVPMALYYVPSEIESNRSQGVFTPARDLHIINGMLAFMSGAIVATGVDWGVGYIWPPQYQAL